MFMNIVGTVDVSFRQEVDRSDTYQLSMGVTKRGDDLP